MCFVVLETVEFFVMLTTDIVWFNGPSIGWIFANGLMKLVYDYPGIWNEVLPNCIIFGLMSDTTNPLLLLLFYGSSKYW